MSFLTRKVLRSTPRVSGQFKTIFAGARPFHASCIRAALSESDLSRRKSILRTLGISRMIAPHQQSESYCLYRKGPQERAKMISSKAEEDRAADIDHHKHDQLEKQKEGKGHWKGELGSNSESAVWIITKSSAKNFGLTMTPSLRNRSRQTGTI